MSVKIRLRRTGANNDVCYRVVATDSRSPRDGRFIEVLGWYDPKKKGINFQLKLDRIQHWTARGAIVSDTVASLIKKNPAAPVAEPVAT
jgi:small subunit ribosomal protein S16